MELNLKKVPTWLLCLVALFCFTVAMRARADAPEPTRTFFPEIWEDEERGVVCYRTVGGTGTGVALSCLPMEMEVDLDGN